MLNGGFGHQVAMAVLLRERGYLIENAGRRAAEARPARERRVGRSLQRALRFAAAGLALALRAMARG